MDTVTVTVTMPVSVRLNGNVGKPNDIAVRRNGHRYRGRLTDKRWKKRRE